LQDRDPAQVTGSPAGAVGCAADRGKAGHTSVT